MKQFRSILAIATVVTSITANSLPSQASIWDELLGVVKKGVVKALVTPSESTPSNNESTTSAPVSNSESEPSDPEFSDSSSQP